MPERFTLIEEGNAHALEASVSEGRVALSTATEKDALGWELKP